MHLRSAKLKPMGLLHGNSLGCLLRCHCCESRVGCCWRWKRGRRDGLSSMLFEFPSTDVDDAHRTLVKATPYACGSQSYDMHFHYRATCSYVRVRWCFHQVSWIMLLDSIGRLLPGMASRVHDTCMHVQQDEAHPHTSRRYATHQSVWTASQKVGIFSLQTSLLTECLTYSHTVPAHPH